MVKGVFNVRRRNLRGNVQGRTNGTVPLAPAGEAPTELPPPPPPSPPLDAALLLESLPDGAMLVDSARRVTAVNAGLRRLLGRDAAFRRNPESFAALARRLALAGEYALIGLGDLIEPDGHAPGARQRVAALASGATLRVTASPTADGGTLLLFAPVAPAGADIPSEDLAREVLKRMPGAILRLRLDSAGNAHCAYASPQSHEIFGIEAERMMREGTNLLDFVHPEERAAVAHIHAAQLASPGAIDHECRIVGVSGTTVWARVTGSAFRDETGAVYGDMRLFDIGDRVQVARHLRRLLDMVVEHLPHIVTVRDVSDMRYVLINRAAHEILGARIPDLLGKADAGIFPDEVRSRRRHRTEAVIGSKAVHEFPDLMIDTPARGRRIFKTTKYPMLDDDGVLRYILSINEDVTERRQAQDALRRSEQRLREAIESFSDGLALYDGDDRLVLCNRRYREMWPGIAEVARPGVSFEDILRAVATSGGLRKPVTNIDAYVAERITYHRDPPATREVPLADGTWLQVNDRATAEGGIVVTCADITALKEREDTLRRTGREALRAKEAAENANRSKSDFLANMSHELRTPLNAVIGFSEIIKDALLGEDPGRFASYRAYAADIHSSGHHLLSLINDILDMAKIEAGKLELFEEEIDPSQIVESSLVLVRERANVSRVSLAALHPDNLPRLRADGRKVKQILINLLSNAVKFTKPGGRVTVDAFVGAAGEYVLRVADTGIGIRPEDIGKALEPFGQVDDGLARSYEGTGLGLTLTKSLVELHGGRLEIVSRCDEPPTGTTVSAIFPASRVVSRGGG